MGIFKNIFAILIGFLVSILFLVCAEGISRLFYDDPLLKIERQWPAYNTVDDFGIKKPRTGEYRAYAKDTETGQFIYDIIYSIDTLNRRGTPVRSQKCDKFIAFFGGSFTYGEGVQDNETLSFYVGELADQYRPYNYGFHAGGPFDALAKVENYNLKEQIKEEDGILIYTFIEPHLRRTLGSMNVINWKYGDPYYVYNDAGELVRKGSFKSGRYLITQMYRLISKLTLLRRFNIDIPYRRNDSHHKLVVDALVATKAKFQKQYPNSKFYVLMYPSLGMGNTSNKIMEYLKNADIQYIDYSQLFDHKNVQYQLPHDEGHPSALAYKTIAESLVRDLELSTSSKNSPKKTNFAEISAQNKVLE